MKEILKRVLVWIFWVFIGLIVLMAIIEIFSFKDISLSPQLRETLIVSSYESGILSELEGSIDAWAQANCDIDGCKGHPYEPSQCREGAIDICRNYLCPSYCSGKSIPFCQMFCVGVCSDKLTDICEDFRKSIFA